MSATHRLQVKYTVDLFHIYYIDIYPSISGANFLVISGISMVFFHSYFPENTKTFFLASYKLRFFRNVDLIGRMGELKIRVIIQTNGK